MARNAFSMSRSDLTPRLPMWVPVAAILMVLTDGRAVAHESPQESISRMTRALSYSDNTARLLRETVDGWSDAAGHRYLDNFAKNLSTVEGGCSQGWGTEEHLIRAQIETVRALGQCIERAIPYELDYFDLPRVLEAKKANCFGYAQLLYVLGNAVGLSVRVVAVSEAQAFSPAGRPGHIANIVDLADGTVVYADLTRGADCVSEPFALPAETLPPREEPSGRMAPSRRSVPVLGESMPLAETHIVWAQNRSGAPISVDSKKLAILDGNDLVAEIHFSRGTVANLAGRSAEAIGHYSKAIELSPRCARAYNNRGAVHLLGQEYETALTDFDKAIEFDLHYVQAWQNRGSAYLGLGQYDEAIAQYTEAIRLAPSLSDPLFCRGYARVQLARYAEGIDDYTRAIALAPTSARIFYRRGIAYARMGDNEEARADLARAVELDGAVADSVAEVSRQLGLGQ